MKQLKIGRSNNCDIVINDATVSSEHLEIFQDDEGNVFITDLESSNGTFVNGERIIGSSKINQNDIVKIGNSVLPWRNYLKEGHQQTELSELVEEKSKSVPSNVIIESPTQTIVIKEKSHFVRNLFLGLITIILIGAVVFILLPEETKRELYEGLGIENSDFVRENSLKSYVRVQNYIENRTLGGKLAVKAMLYNDHPSATIRSVTLRYNFTDGSEDRKSNVNIPPGNSWAKVTNEKFSGRKKNSLRSIEVISASE